MSLSQRVLELEQKGFIPFDGESETNYLNRVDLLSGRMEEFHDLITQKPSEIEQFIGGDISQVTMYDEPEWKQLVEDAYDFTPHTKPIFMLNATNDVWVKSSSPLQSLKLGAMRIVNKAFTSIYGLFGMIQGGYTGPDICIEYKDVLIPTAFIMQDIYPEPTGTSAPERMEALRIRNFNKNFREETAAHECMHIIRDPLFPDLKPFEMIFPFNFRRFGKERDKLLEEGLAFYLEDAAHKMRDFEDYEISVFNSTGASNLMDGASDILNQNLNPYLNKGMYLSMSAFCVLAGYFNFKRGTTSSKITGALYTAMGLSEAYGLYTNQKALPGIIWDMLEVEDGLSEMHGQKAGQAIFGRLRREEIHELAEIIDHPHQVTDYLDNQGGLRWDIIRERYL